MDSAGDLTHINEKGQAQMVDISGKNPTERTATAYGEIYVNEKVATAIKTHQIKKGEVLQVARIAGILAAKKTFESIPLCHLISLTKCEVDFEWRESQVLAVKCTAKTVGATGVEMEALMGVNVSLLTVYDMCKALDKKMIIKNIHLLEKKGGKSGDFNFYG